MIDLVNEERAKAGLSPLTMDAALMDAAGCRAGEIVTLFDHTRPDGSHFASALVQYGVTYTDAGENIAAGFSTPEAVVEGWMNSAGHRANILSESYTRIGVGYAKASDTEYVYYWVQNFAD